MTTERYSGDELWRYRELQRLAYDCAEQVAAALQPGVTEREAAARFGAALRARGADGFFHTPFAWFGERAGFYDHERSRNPLTNVIFARRFFPTDTALERGMPAILDAAPILDGRCADIGYTFSLGGNAELDDAMVVLGSLRALILELILQERTMRDVYRSVDAAIASAGYENAHRIYPSRVLGHKVGAIPLRGRRSPTIAGFDARTLLYFSRQLLPALPGIGRTPLWNDSRLADVRPAPGLWAFEPHIRRGGIGAKWEEILVITDSDAYWLDDELPHVRALTAS